MKYIKILSIIATSLMVFASCDDQLMDWQKDPDHAEVTGAELPLKLVEKISRYDILKNYTAFKLGAGVGLDLYMNNESYRKLTNENFDEVTIGYEMKHGAMVNSKGEINFSKVDAFIAKVKEAGLSVYGHTLVWHSNQNSSYLNGLIAPTIIPAAAGSNSLNLSSLQAGNTNGWGGSWNTNITVVDGAGLTTSSKAIKMIASTSSSNPWDLQLGTPDVIIVNGHSYEVSFYVKSDVAGKGRLSFDASVINQYPWFDWYNSGVGSTEAFVTTSQWKQVKVKLNASDFKIGSSSFKFNFDMGFLPNVTYLIDVDNIKVVDLDAVPVVVNLIANGNFETGALTGWNGYGNGSSRAISANGDGYNGGYAMTLTNPTASNNYSAQQVYALSKPLGIDVEYTMSFMVKATAAVALQVEVQGADYNADYYGGISVGTTWTQVIKTIKPTKADRDKIIFDFGADVATYYIDDIVLSTKDASSGGSSEPTIIQKTESEKALIISNAMKDWISKMVTHYKSNVSSWDVVNEPMREDGTLRTGNEGDTAEDYFSWAKYLGKDNAVTAFKLARQYGNSTDKLFINDYNLESSLAKCDGLIDYVKYIESQGAIVDGIGTQMHISINTDKVKIVQMFQKLAASGKWIKVSELDVRLGTNSPTVAQQASQSEMYQYVIDMYMKYIPVAQQYGITIWGISDNKNEHEYWLPDESPNLWDANYARKHAYKGVADGLAGKDVSIDFSGELSGN